MTTFDRAFEIVIGVEKGLADDPLDPGGLTKWGISQKSYPNLDIRNLTLEEAKQIYARDYFAPIHGQELPELLAIAVFDCAVNQGPGTAINILQDSLNVKQDGKMGPQTIAAAAAAGPNVLDDFFAARGFNYGSQTTFFHFGRGWMKRLFGLQRKLLTASNS
jgi:lysozyme family protein